MHILSQKKEENKMRLSSQLAVDVKDTVKTEIFQELTDLIHTQIKE